MRACDLKSNPKNYGFALRQEGKVPDRRSRLRLRQWKLLEKRRNLQGLGSLSRHCSLCGEPGHTRGLHVEAVSGVMHFQNEDGTTRSGRVWTATSYSELKPARRRAYGVGVEPVVQRIQKNPTEAVKAFVLAYRAWRKGNYVKPHYRVLLSILRLCEARKLDGNHYAGREVAKRLRMKYSTCRRRGLELKALLGQL